MPGNHEYHTAGAESYFQYLVRAGEPGQGITATTSAWHIVALNSNCGEGGAVRPARPRNSGCAPTWPPIPPPARWPTGITCASAPAGMMTSPAPALLAGVIRGGADLVLVGHDHNYQRWAPRTRRGRPTRCGGCASLWWVPVRPLRDQGRAVAPRNRKRRCIGVFRLTLRADGYDWAFLP